LWAIVGGQVAGCGQRKNPFGFLSKTTIFPRTDYIHFLEKANKKPFARPFISHYFGK
jgi:hypothetical protein